IESLLAQVGSTWTAASGPRVPFPAKRITLGGPQNSRHCRTLRNSDSTGSTSQYEPEVQDRFLGADHSKSKTWTVHGSWFSLGLRDQCHLRPSRFALGF